MKKLNEGAVEKTKLKKIVKMKEKTGSRSQQATFGLDKTNLLFLVSLLVIFSQTDYTYAKVMIIIIVNFKTLKESHNFHFNCDHKTFP